MNIVQATLMTEAIQQQRRQKIEQDLAEAEWQWDEQAHKHYRMLGKGAKEYAPTVTVHGMEIENIGDNLKKANEAFRKKQEGIESVKVDTQQKTNLCPFNSTATLGAVCGPDCALYGPTGCRMKKTAQKETKGQTCPFMRQCNEKCAMYDNGCTL